MAGWLVTERGRLTLLVCGWTLLTAAWVVGNPPFEAPDEGDHYIRTVGVTQGELVGRSAPEQRIGATERQIARTRQEGRVLSLPADLAPPSCQHLASEPVTCTPAPGRAEERFTGVGTYQPLPYLLPATVLELGDTPSASLRWGRAASAVAALLFLGLAAAMLFTPGRPEAVFGLTAAVTPMVLFVASALNGSGLETASGFAFLAGLMRLTRSEPAPGWAWVVTGIAGGVLAASRGPGPIWVILGLVLALALVGWSSARERVTAAGGAGSAAAGAIALGVVANRVWEAAHGADNSLALFSLANGVELGVEQWWGASSQVVGAFGHLEYQLPIWISLAWAGAVISLCTVAWRSSPRHERLVLAGVAVAAATFPFLFYVFVIREIGFGLQGRHVLVVVAALPLVAGELLHRSGARVAPITVAVGASLLGLLQVAAFYLSSRRYAVGSDGPLFFMPDAAWSPPLGWWPVLTLAAIGGLAVAATGLVAPSHNRP